MVQGSEFSHKPTDNTSRSSNSHSIFPLSSPKYLVHRINGIVYQAYCRIRRSLPHMAK